MKLRSRLIATLAAVTVPTALFLVWLDATASHRAAGQVLEHAVPRDLVSQREACERSPQTWGGDFSRLQGLRPPSPWDEDRPPSRLADDGPPPSRGLRLHEELPAPGRGMSPPDGMPPLPADLLPPLGRNGRGLRPIIAYAYDVSLHAARLDAPPIDPVLAKTLTPGDMMIVPARLTNEHVDLLVRTPWDGPCAYILARASTSTWGAVLPRTSVWLVPTVVALGVLLLALGPVVGRMRRLAIAVRRSAASGYEIPVVADGRDEIGELSRAFAEAGAEIRARILELERRERALRDFVANTTHDVTIPLTVLQGHLARLRVDGSREPSVAAAMNEAHYVAALLHNLGLAARLDSAAPMLHRTRVDLSALLQRVASRHRPVAVEKGIAVEVAASLDNVCAMADVTLLEQAVSNITYNAVRHGRDGGHVALIAETSLASDGSQRFCLRVLDDGPGIPSDQIDDLMQRGARGNEARNRDQGGQGLGLDIAARAVAIQGFALTLKNADGGGLEARIEGPLASAATV